MDFRQLEYFVRVAELGSFTKAAQLLDIAQSALSRQVRALEVELRQNLLVRNGRGATPTEAGKRLLAHSRGILLQFERAREAVEGVRNAPVGHLVIGLPHSIARILTAPFLNEFRRRFPQATVSVMEGLTIHLHEWLVTGRVDIALLYDPVPSPALHTEPLREDDLFLIGPAIGRGMKAAQPLPLRDLPNFPLIIPSRPHPLRMLIESRLANLGRKPNIVLEIDSVPAIGDLVEQGLGFAVMTFNALPVRAGLGRFSARRITSPRLRSVLVMASSSERPLTTLATQCLQLIKEFMPATLENPRAAVRR